MTKGEWFNPSLRLARRQTLLYFRPGSWHPHARCLRLHDLSTIRRELDLYSRMILLPLPHMRPVAVERGGPHQGSGTPHRMGQPYQCLQAQHCVFDPIGSVAGRSLSVATVDRIRYR